MKKCEKGANSDDFPEIHVFLKFHKVLILSCFLLALCILDKAREIPTWIYGVLGGRIVNLNFPENLVFFYGFLLHR